MNIIDISLPLNEQTIIYPNNPLLKIEPAQSATSALSKVTIGTHTGTHVDAPRHVFSKGPGVDKISLKAFMGTCRVLDMTHVKKGIAVSDLSSVHVKKRERILVKTKNSLRGFKTFREDFIYLESEAAEFLAEKKIALFGIDSLSIKQKGNMDNRAHTALLKKNIPIVEGINLKKVTPGVYTFIGLPLFFTGIDGAPLRAVLVRGKIL